MDKMKDDPSNRPLRYWLIKAAVILVILGLMGALIAVLSHKVSFVKDEIADSKGAVMRLVPAGEFTMGNDQYGLEKPVHQVVVDAFYMDKYEVTNASYKACVDAGTCDPPHETSSHTHPNYYGNPFYSEYPALKVDWNQANTYCNWRGARLPTEAEWEKAARGTDGRTYPWGNEWDVRTTMRLNFSDKNDHGPFDSEADDGYGDTAPVGSYPDGVSPYGLFDMAGNVWEWVADRYDEYPGNPDNFSYEGAILRVNRGGSWNDDDFETRVSNRSWNFPDGWFINLGFRCARAQ